jgi:hypothetical protein
LAKVYKKEIAMLKKASMLALIVGVASVAAASADDSLVKFRGGIGVIPVSAGAGTPDATDGTSPTVSRNVVRSVNPPGQIWRIADLSAEVSVDGRIRVSGKGLLLAGGNGIGGTAGQKVLATLICEAAAPFTLRSTAVAGVALQANGDFEIDDMLSPAPAACASPVLLIRNVAGAWFAAGIPEAGHDH